jgi:hypothetical protein
MIMLPLSFLTFCIELYADHTHTPSPEVYRLFVKTALPDMEWDFVVKNDKNGCFWGNLFIKCADNSKIEIRSGNNLYEK